MDGEIKMQTNKFTIQYHIADISDDLLNVVLDCCSSPPTEESLLFFVAHPAGYKTTEMAEESSAFPYRQAK